MKPHLIRYVSVNVGPTAGADDVLVAVRVVPAGREGLRVLGRALRLGEVDTGEPIAFHPYAGEELHFPSGSIQVRLEDIDSRSTASPDGYAPVANSLWTWLSIGAPTDPSLFRFLLAAARRLDAAHSLCCDVLTELEDKGESFIWARDRVFSALGYAELMCVAFSRAIEMIHSIPAQFSVSVDLPETVTCLLPPLRQLRNAFEHIEDRALGKVHGRAHPDALTIFDQRDLLTHATLRYGSHSIRLREDVLPALVASRRAVLLGASAQTGAAKTLTQPITFPPAPPRSFERIRERAYFLWADRTGSQWWDAEANWLEAERADATEYRHP
jgi:hypothetical protein